MCHSSALTRRCRMESVAAAVLLPVVLVVMFVVVDALRILDEACRGSREPVL